jgi:hypothetical protein
MLVVFGPGLLCAQKYEIDPYAGGFFPGKFVSVINVKNEGIYGLKGGVFLNRRLQIGGNAGYISDLSFKDTLTRKRAYIWDGDLSVHAGDSLKVYGAFGLGGVVTTVSHDSTFFFDPSLLTRDHFLSISYGGGIKVLRIWGPLGFRVDARGRTMPHYYGFRFSWLETTAGPTFSWGER